MPATAETADAGGQPVTDTPTPPPDPVTPLPGREPGEPARWYGRFLRYVALGPVRSLLAAYNREPDRKGQTRSARAAPPSWRNVAASWQWAARAAEWDEQVLDRRRTHEAEQFAKDVETYQARWRRAEADGFAMAELMRGKARERLATLDPATLTAADVVALVKAATGLADWADHSAGLYLGTAEFVAERRLEASRERQLTRRNNRKLDRPTLPDRPPIDPPRPPADADPPAVKRVRPVPDQADDLTTPQQQRWERLLVDFFGDDEDAAAAYLQRYDTMAQAFAELERLKRDGGTP
jgi:hypothetical protein